MWSPPGGPLLYVNDMNAHLICSKVHMHADHFQIYTHQDRQDIDSMFNYLNTDSVTILLRTNKKGLKYRILKIERQ